MDEIEELKKRVAGLEKSEAKMYLSLSAMADTVRTLVKLVRLLCERMSITNE